MAFNPKKLITEYFKKKKPLSIVLDGIFVILLLLLLIPYTRKETAAFFIQLTSFPASTLDEDEQFRVTGTSNQWELHDLSGNKTNYGSLNDKPVFLNIWATWCPPCIAEIPSIQELYREFGQEVNFILVSNENADIVKAFADKNNYNDLPFYFSRSVPPVFSSSSIPTTFIIDKNGLVLVDKKGAARWNSSKTKSLLKQLIEQ